MQNLIVANFGMIMLVASVFFSAALYRINFFKKRIANHFVNLFAVYIFIIVAIFGFDLYLTWKLQSFDVDGNGIFTADESTEEQFFYQGLVISDLGRNFSIIWALFVSPFVVLSGFFLNWLLKKLANDKAEIAPTKTGK